MNFSENLHRFRSIKNVKVKEIASDLGVSEAAYLSWETGAKEP
ncbi:XRE family transcriptional regulator [Anaerovibrio sp. RM50]|nr:XRE family transcriptional regulator [Anaerovibrio sp. RM50]